MPENTKINRPVHCRRCGKILFKVKEGDKIDVRVRCGKCGLEQQVKSEQIYNIKIR